MFYHLRATKEVFVGNEQISQGKVDADNLIINTALEYSHVDSGVYVVCKDTAGMIFIIDQKLPDESITLIHP